MMATLSENVRGIRMEKHRIADLKLRIKEAEQELERLENEVKQEYPLLLQPITVLGFDNATLNKLTKRYNFVYELFMLVEWQLPDGIGKSTYNKIRDRMRENGIDRVYRG